MLWWPICRFARVLALQLVRFVPATDIDGNIPANVMIIRLDVAVVVVPFHHGRDEFAQEFQSLSSVVLFVPILVYLQV